MVLPLHKFYRENVPVFDLARTIVPSYNHLPSQSLSILANSILSTPPSLHYLFYLLNMLPSQTTIPEKMWEITQNVEDYLDHCQ